MKLNPYVEILARARYREDVCPIPFPSEDMELVKDAVEFMNCLTYFCRFSISVDCCIVLDFQFET